MPSYRILHAGRVVGLCTVEAGALVGKVRPDLLAHRDRLRREIEQHAAGPFSDLSCRFGLGGRAFLLIPAVKGEPPPLPAVRDRIAAVTS